MGATRLRAALAVLGTSSAFSWPVLAVYAPLGIAIQVTGNVGPFGGPPARWALASAIGMVVLGAVLAALGLVYRHRQPRPAAVLAAYTVGAIVQPMTFGLASVALGASDELHLTFRVVGLLLHLPLLTAIGYAVCSHNAHLRVIADLERARTRLLAIGQSLDAEIVRLETELTDTVRSTLAPALDALGQALAQTAGGSERATAIGALDALVEDRIRPLSHELAAGPVRPDDPVDEAAVRARVPLPARFRLANGIGAGFVGVTIAIVALPTALHDLTIAQVLLYEAAFAGGSWAALALIRRALRGVELPTLVGVIAVVAINVAAGSAVFRAVGAAGIARPAGISVAVAFVFALVGVLAAGTLLVRARRAASEAELAEVNERLEEALAVRRRRQRLVMRRLAFVLHGSLQGALHAAAVRIARAEVVDDALTADIRRDVDAALAQIDTPPDASGRTATMIAELTEVWSGLHRVTSRVEPAAAVALRADADADEAVAEVVREAANNAFRHGRADHVEIAVALADDQSAIAITVRDDGTGCDVESRPGLGSALFDDLCGSWTATGDANGTTFRAVIPLSAAYLAVAVHAPR